MTRLSSDQLVLLALLAACANSARAADQADFVLKDGNALLAVCGEFVSAVDRNTRFTEREAVSITTCVSYLRGFSHGVALLSNEPAQGYGYCIEESVPMKQVARVVVKHLQESPQFLHHHPAVLVSRALRASFPCKDR